MYNCYKILFALSLLATACTPDPEIEDYRLPYTGSFYFESFACPIMDTADSCTQTVAYEGSIDILASNRLQIQFRPGVASPYTQWAPYMDSLALLRFPENPTTAVDPEYLIEGRFLSTDSLYVSGQLLKVMPNFLWEIRGRRVKD
jgi:hypothetical protein